jgi:hypothetical protein
VGLNPLPPLVGSISTDSIAAHRTRREHCLVIRPRRTAVSDSWREGLSSSAVVRIRRIRQPASAFRIGQYGP